MDDKQELNPAPLASSSAGELVVRSPMLARRGLEQLGAQTLLTSALETLALAIAATTGVQPGVFLRVPRLATALAERLGMSLNEIQGVRLRRCCTTLASSPSRRTSSRSRARSRRKNSRRYAFTHGPRRHHQRGTVPLSSRAIDSQPSRTVGRASGYPARLEGQEIPLGARILTVVDYFDALTSDRSYHKAMTRKTPRSHYSNRKPGNALDPAIVPMFVQVCRERSTTELTVETRRRRRSIGRSRPRTTGGRPPAGSNQDQVRSSKTSRCAHREIHALYEIAQTMGTSLGIADTMALISSKLSNLVPFSACALFLFDEEPTRCAAASRPASMPTRSAP